MGSEGKAVLIEKGFLPIFYNDNSVKALDIASGNFVEIEGAQAGTISNILYKCCSELSDSELKLVEEIPYFAVKDVKTRKGRCITRSGAGNRKRAGGHLRF